MGLSPRARARTLRPDHAVDLQPCRAGRGVRGPHQRRQQPRLLRAHLGHQPLRRAAAAALRLLLPGLGQPHALRDRSVRRGARLRLRQVPRSGAGVDPRTRQRARRHAVAAAGAGGRGQRQAPRGPGLHGAGQHADHAGPALRHRRGPRHGRQHRPRDARRGLRGLVRTGPGKGPLPAVRRRALPGRAALREPPARSTQAEDPRARTAQFAPAVDRAHGHDLARLRGQRLGRHRAHFLVDLHPQEAHARRHQAGVRGRGLRLPALPPHGRRRGAPAAVLRARAGDGCARPHEDDRGGTALRRLGHQQDRQRARGLSVRRLPQPLPRGLEVGAQGHHHLPPEQRDRLGSRGQVRARRHAAVHAPGPAGRSRPPRAPRLGTPARAGEPQVAGPAGPVRRQHGLDLHGRDPLAPRELRDLHRPGGRARAALRGLGQWRRAAARPGRDRQVPLDGHALRGPRLAEDEARGAGQVARRARLLDPLPAGRRAHLAERRGLGLRQHRALAL